MTTTNNLRRAATTLLSNMAPPTAPRLPRECTILRLKDIPCSRATILMIAVVAVLVVESALVLWLPWLAVAAWMLSFKRAACAVLYCYSVLCYYLLC